MTHQKGLSPIESTCPCACLISLAASSIRQCKACAPPPHTTPPPVDPRGDSSEGLVPHGIHLALCLLDLLAASSRTSRRSLSPVLPPPQHTPLPCRPSLPPPHTHTTLPRLLSDHDMDLFVATHVTHTHSKQPHVWKPSASTRLTKRACPPWRRPGPEPV